jgi:hypothetical protein
MTLEQVDLSYVKGTSEQNDQFPAFVFSNDGGRHFPYYYQNYFYDGSMD